MIEELFSVDPETGEALKKLDDAIAEELEGIKDLLPPIISEYRTRGIIEGIDSELAKRVAVNTTLWLGHLTYEELLKYETAKDRTIKEWAETLTELVAGWKEDKTKMHWPVAREFLSMLGADDQVVKDLTWRHVGFNLEKITLEERYERRARAEERFGIKIMNLEVPLEQLYETAKLAKETQQPPEIMIRIYNKILVDNPEDAGIHETLAREYSLNKNYENAEKHARKAFQLSDGEKYEEFMLQLEMQHRYDEAIEAMGTPRPNEHNKLRRLSDLYGFKGDKENARATLDIIDLTRLNKAQREGVQWHYKRLEEK